MSLYYKAGYFLGGRDIAENKTDKDLAFMELTPEIYYFP